MLFLNGNYTRGMELMRYLPVHHSLTYSGYTTKIRILDSEIVSQQISRPYYFS